MLFFFLCMAANFASAFETDAGNYCRMLEMNLKDGIPGKEGVMYFRDLEKIAGSGNEIEISALSEVDSLAAGYSKLCPVRVVMTRHNYEDFSDIRIVKGSFLTQQQCTNARNVVVISEELAFRLFSSYNIIGNQIELFNGEKYKIAGIYKKKSSIISFLGFDGADRVYVPFESYNKLDTTPVKTLLIRYKGLEALKFKEYTIQYLLFQKDGIDTSAYRTTDYYTAPAALAQYKTVFIFLIGVWSVYMLLAMLVRYLRKNYCTFRDRLKDMYFLEMLKTEKPLIIRILLVIIITLAIITGIYSMIRFKLNIPPQYIPQDNIFEFRFYMNTIKQAISAENSSYGYVPTVFETDFKNTLLLCIFSVICSVVLFISTVAGIRLLKIADQPVYTLLKGIFIALAVGILLSITFVCIMGLRFVFPVKELIVTGVFCIICFIYKKYDMTRNINT